VSPDRLPKPSEASAETGRCASCYAEAPILEGNRESRFARPDAAQWWHALWVGLARAMVDTLVLADYLGERMLVVPRQRAHRATAARHLRPCVRASIRIRAILRTDCAGTRPANAPRLPRAGIKSWQTAQKIDQEILRIFASKGQAQPRRAPPRR